MVCYRETFDDWSGSAVDSPWDLSPGHGRLLTWVPVVLAIFVPLGVVVMLVVFAGQATAAAGGCGGG